MPKDIKLRSNRRREQKPEPILVPRKATRIRNNNSILARILRDERISPNRALLASFVFSHQNLGMKDGKEVPMTPQQARDKEMFYNVIITQWGNPKNIQWQDREDAGSDPQTSENLDAGDKLRVMFEEVLRPALKENDDSIQS